MNLPPSTTSLGSKEKKPAIDSWVAGDEEDHLLPPLKCLAAVDKIALTVRMTTVDSQDENGDVEHCRRRTAVRLSTAWRETRGSAGKVKTAGPSREA
ncbi:hypothetical protein JCM3774_004601 [Rhodotorula dairenensis]